MCVSPAPVYTNVLLFVTSDQCYIKQAASVTVFTIYLFFSANIIYSAGINIRHHNILYLLRLIIASLPPTGFSLQIKTNVAMATAGRGAVPKMSAQSSTVAPGRKVTRAAPPFPALKKLEDSLSSDGVKIVAAIKLEMERQLQQQSEEFKALIAVKDEEVAVLRTELTEVRKVVTRLEARIDDGDAYERRDTLIFSGDGIPVGSADESCREMISSLVTEKL